MDKEKAKAFLFDATHDTIYGNTLYKSKDLQKLLDMNDGGLFFIYAIVETINGDMLMDMDWSYSREPIEPLIMNTFTYLDYFLKYHWDKKVINLDE